ncbi:MAG: helix-turn-helix transcriptional regulator [Dysosmobacter sp.]
MMEAQTRGGDTMEFSKNLSRERKARGLSQEELAARLGVSRQAVSKWETGEAAPDLSKLLALADALELPLDTLCGRETSGGPSAAPAAAEPSVPPAPGVSPRLRLWQGLCGVLALLLLACGVWIWYSAARWCPRRTPLRRAPCRTPFPRQGSPFPGTVPGNASISALSPASPTRAAPIRSPSPGRTTSPIPLTRRTAAASAPAAQS